MKIVRSIKRYISHQAYGGHQYENTELLVVYEEEIKNIKYEDYKEASELLYKRAKTDIDKSVIEVKKSIIKERSSDKELISPF